LPHLDIAFMEGAKTKWDLEENMFSLVS